MESHLFWSPSMICIRANASYSYQGLVVAVILWTCCEPWQGNSLGVVKRLVERIFIILSDQFCGPEVDSNWVSAELLSFEDCKAIAQTIQPPWLDEWLCYLSKFLFLAINNYPNLHLYLIFTALDRWRLPLKLCCQTTLIWQTFICLKVC